MSFEITHKDLMGRLGRLETKNGILETPALLPVINPSYQPEITSTLLKDLQCNAIIANAYFLKKRYGNQVIQHGVHGFLNFNGIVMTDSGAYQLLIYGDVDITPIEIVRYQEAIKTDIAVILDIPTGWNVKEAYAAYTVNETLKRAKMTLEQVIDKDILWVGPIQGGNHIDLVAYSAKKISDMPFDLYALGSPTQVMEQYLFDVLTDMIITAKAYTPIEKPLHLFGAGHPFMFSLAVALGCDTFDSAAYALFARQQKYLTSYGTIHLKDLEYFPCSCPMCQKYEPRDLKELPRKEREHLLVKHNLFACFLEIKRIKQALHEGRLWELLELRARSHPKLLNALKHLKVYASFFEEASPSNKRKGVFIFDVNGLYRPAITQYQKKLSNWKPPAQYRVLVFIPSPSSRPFHRSQEFRRLVEHMRAREIDLIDIHFCVFGFPFGVAPLELDEIFPLSHFETSNSSTYEVVEHVSKQVKKYILSGQHGCTRIVIHVPKKYSPHFDKSLWEDLKSNFHVYVNYVDENIWSRSSIDRLVTKILSALVDIERRIN